MIDEAATLKYLAKWKTKGIISNLIFAVLAFVGGVVVLFLTFWLTYAIIFIGTWGVSAISELAFNHRVHLSHPIRLIGSGIFIVLLFVQYFRTDPLYWGEYPKQDYVAAPGMQAMGGLAISSFWLLAHPVASANMIADLLLSGPRLVIGAWRLMQKAVQLKKMDLEPCSRLLVFLAQRGRLVPYGELYGVGWEPAMQQIRVLEGVNFLEKGMSLSEELKVELAGERMP